MIDSLCVINNWREDDKQIMSVLTDWLIMQCTDIKHLCLPSLADMVHNRMPHPAAVFKLTHVTVWPIVTDIAHNATVATVI